MAFVDFVGERHVLKVFLVLVFPLVDGGNADVGLDGGGVELDDSLEAGAGHLVLAQVEETVGHANSGFGGQAPIGLQALLVEIQGLLVVLFEEIDLGQHYHRTHQQILALSGLLDLLVDPAHEIERLRDLPRVVVQQGTVQDDGLVHCHTHFFAGVEVPLGLAHEFLGFLLGD